MPAVSESFADFSGGIITGVSESARGFNYLKAADNIIFDPKRALASRPGYRAVSDSVLGYAPTSLMRWYGVSTTETFVAASTKIYKIVAGGAYVLQSLPMTPGTGKWSHTNLNGLLICAQEGSADPPLIYDGTAWMSSTLPTPANSFTLAEGIAGNVDVGLHSWRIRWRFKNGASLACTAKDLEILTSAKKAELTVIPLSARSDYIGFSVERTKVGEPGLWYWVGDSASKTAVIFTDNTADADLGDLIAAEPGPYGAAPHFEGVIAHVDRLFGWSGTNLYVSRGIGEENGSGVLNFNPLQMYPIKADDGDPIMTAVPQVDRLVILKRMSLHTFLGYDPESFARVQIDDSVGAASTRGAAAASGLVFFYGGHNRLFVISGNAVRGFGDTEVGEYLATILQNQDDLVQVYNYRGESILFCYPKAAATYCDEIVEYSLADRNWQHHTNIRVAAALCPKVDAEFGGATMLFADPKLLDIPGGGGTIYLGRSYVIWQDSRTPSGIYVQELNGSGVDVLPANGVRLGERSASARDDAFADGSGNLFVAWSDYVSHQIMVQKMNSLGIGQWGAASGVVIASGAGWRYDVQCCSDGAGGMIVAWIDSRGGSYQQLYAQRVDASGAVLWTVNGVAIRDVAGSSIGNLSWHMASDGSGGAFLVWGNDERSGSTAQQVYAQWIPSTGVVSWTANGVALHSAVTNRLGIQPDLLPDGAGGIYVFWARPAVANGNYVIYGQRLNSSGAAQWTANGILFSNAGVRAEGPRCVASGSDALVVWTEGPDGYGMTRIRAQRINSSGVAAWTTGGVSLIADQTALLSIDICADASGGAVVFIKRNDNPPISNLVQRVSSAGALQWGSGVSPTSFVGGTNDPSICFDGTSGFLLAWRQEQTPGSYLYDVFVQRLDSAGATWWGLTGKYVRSVPAASTSFPKIVLDTAYASSTLPTDGYYVWSAFVGELDQANYAGTAGDPVDCYFESPFWDGGEPDTVKDFDRIQFHTKEGNATFSLTIETEDYGTTIGLSVSQSGSIWGGTSLKLDTLIWNQGKWGGRRASHATTGITAGTIGHRARVKGWCSATETFVLEGWDLDALLLPERNY